jgi:4-hydroxy-3-methylbut-2-en-1-yl diphosphate synthase IspG/GcpE
MSKNVPVTTSISPHNPAALTISKSPTWTTLPQPNIQDIQADHRIETNIDATGVGQVRVKPGYNVNFDEIRYRY